MVKNRKKLRGTDGVDELTGTRRNKFVYGFGGDDLIRTEEGRYRVFGGDGNDTFETLNGGKGYMKIMDFEAGDISVFAAAHPLGLSSEATTPGLSKVMT